MVKRERESLTEFIKLYQELPCLWDPRLVTYTNKEARERAYEVLLVKYKEIDEDATIELVRRKIENMRCSFRRERRKVQNANAMGLEHTPLLWYYDLMTFLIEVMNWPLPDAEEQEPSQSAEIETLDMEEFDDKDTIMFVENENDRPRKRKKHSMPISNTSVYLPEHSEADLETQKNDISYSQSSSDKYFPTEEPDAFGKTVGLQLKEIDPMQRVFAEKLISDIIFYGRLNRLNIKTSISVNDDD